ncbi:hypothetical protein GQ55_5G199300 [Panicum hallii var. hallii]|uniref:Wall-associated receptor kinase galacturonan-binding domain-containing protein n=1 Tax=Panicum hallii var. hallii TaxID=1504633 RepID=A0A2T7DI58_9POAL|nr:hypothetical protein GQ55_5G199300 [Panicum hallii var. hallii]
MAPLLLHLLLPTLLLLLAVADALPPSCSEVVTCAGLVVQYPFRLDSSASRCGYPGLDLVCERNATLILPVKSHRYRVFSINYTAHTVVVSDAVVVDEYAVVGCPRLRVNLTIDYASSWLQLTQSDSNVTFFYNCKKNISRSSAVELTGCRQDGKRSYALPDGWITGAEAYEYECEEVVVAPVFDVHKKAIAGAPGPPPGNGSFGFRELLQGGFELNYDTHSQLCDGCERSGGWCGYRHNQTNGGMNFTCFCDGGPATARCGTCVPPLPPAMLFLDFLPGLGFRMWVVRCSLRFRTQSSVCLFFYLVLQQTCRVATKVRSDGGKGSLDVRILHILLVKRSCSFSS